MKTSILGLAIIALYPLLCEAICAINNPMPDDCQQAAMKLVSDPSHITTYCTDRCANPLLTDCENSDIGNLTLALCAMQGERYCYNMYKDTMDVLSDLECSHTCTAYCRALATDIANDLGCCLAKYTELNVSSDVITGLSVLSLCDINIEQFCSNSTIFTHIESTTTNASSTTTQPPPEAPTTTEEPTAEEQEEPDRTNTEELATEEPRNEEPIADANDEPNVENHDCIQDQYPQECRDQLHRLTPNSSYNVVANAVSIICSAKCLELTMQQVKCENNTVINVHTLCMLHNNEYCYARYLQAVSMVPDKCFEEETCSGMCSEKYKLFSKSLGCCLGTFGDTKQFGTVLASCNITVDQPCDITLPISGAAVNGPSLFLTAIVIGAIMLNKLY